MNNLTTISITSSTGRSSTTTTRNGSSISSTTMSIESTTTEEDSGTEKPNPSTSNFSGFSYAMGMLTLVGVMVLISLASFVTFVIYNKTRLGSRDIEMAHFRN